MGWLNTAFDIANAGMNATQLAKLRQLQKGTEEQALLNFILDFFKDQLFKVNQLLRPLAGVLDSHPLAVLVTTHVVRQRRVFEIITPDKFSNLVDKEYCAATHRLLAEVTAAAQSRLSPEEQKHAPVVLQLAEKLFKLNRLIHLEEMRTDLQAVGLSDFELKTSQGAWGCLALATLGLVVPVALVFTMTSGEAAGNLVFIASLGLTGFFIVKAIRARRLASALQKLKQKYGENTKFDHAEYADLRREFGENSLQGYNALRYDWVAGTLEPLFAGTGIPYGELFDLPDMPVQRFAPSLQPELQSENALELPAPTRTAEATSVGFCMQCGKPLTANAKFCMYCGQPTLLRED